MLPPRLAVTAAFCGWRSVAKALRPDWCDGSALNGAISDNSQRTMSIAATTAGSSGLSPSSTSASCSSASMIS